MKKFIINMLYVSTLSGYILARDIKLYNDTPYPIVIRYTDTQNTTAQCKLHPSSPNHWSIFTHFPDTACTLEVWWKKTFNPFTTKLEIPADATDVHILQSGYFGFKLQSSKETDKPKYLTPLITAIYENDLPEVKRLLTDKSVLADINAQDSVGYTALQWAVGKNREDIVRLLLTTKVAVAVNTENNFGSTALDLAAAHNNANIARLLLMAGAHIINDTLLPTAIVNDQNDLARVLITYGANVNAQDEIGFTPLYNACLQNNTYLAALLINKGADIDAKNGDGFTALHAVCENGNKEIATLLIKKGADVNAKIDAGTSPLSYAVCYNDNETSAAPQDYVDIARLLLDNGANVNNKDNDGFTPLHIATDMGHEEMARLLLNRGAEVNARTHEGETALDIATQHDDDNLQAVLIAHGATIVTEPSPEERLIIEERRQKLANFNKHIDTYKLPAAHVIPDGTDCAICYDEVTTEGPDNIYQTSCGHFFHKACMHDFVNAVNPDITSQPLPLCPTCRNPNWVGK